MVQIKNQLHAAKIVIQTARKKQGIKTTILLTTILLTSSIISNGIESPQVS
jgi:hypothetical protein